ncbi:hypothetical protein ILUMI_13370 [Ignelater luminosus]|uniref:Transposase IS30-like HTH domain-containing protein n=1 Tax=Ignelater luminosus TaxID=2038154 RepID=A0A8K0CUM4_IGNLU|nr:hypothetical protein ILUMI_13370 [Ignelater luminosus]
MNRRRNLSVEDAVRASTLLEERNSMRYVANLLGRNHSTISRMVERFNHTGSYNRRSALRNRTVTGTMLRNELTIARNVMIYRLEL